MIIGIGSVSSRIWMGLSAFPSVDGGRLSAVPGRGAPCRLVSPAITLVGGQEGETQMNTDQKG
jgi:hypothetical protein